MRAARCGAGIAARGARGFASVADRTKAKPSALRFDRYGDASKVLRLEDVTVPKDVKGNDVLVKMLAAPITPTDLSRIAGFGGNGVFPATGGNEGYGIVEKVGSGVTGLAPGDAVVPAISGLGTWSTHLVADADGLCKVPNTEAVEHAAVSAVNPALAHCLLQMEQLEEGDVVIQNNGGSGVAQCVLQVAAERGLVVVNIRRPHPAMEELFTHYEGLNPAVINVPEPVAVTPRLSEILSDLPAPKLALDGTGGAMAQVVARALGSNGLMVSYGQMARQPVVLTADTLLKKDIRVRGFSLDTWARTIGKDRRDELIRHCVTAATSDAKTYRQLLSWDPFVDWNTAVARAKEDYNRKIVLVMEPDAKKLEPTPRASLSDPVYWKEDAKN